MKSQRIRLRRGFFLVLVLIVVAVATMAVYSFTELMLAYDDSAYLAADLVQARVNVESGAEMIRLVLSNPPEARTDLGGVYNNPQLFQAVVASSGFDGVSPSNFSVIATALDEMGMYGGIRFGLQQLRGTDRVAAQARQRGGARRGSSSHRRRQAAARRRKRLSSDTPHALD